MFPYIAEHVRCYTPQGDFELLIHLDDGSSILYDDIYKSFRGLPANSDDMTRDECKREYGMRLTTIMDRRGISQSVLSEMTGIPQSIISSYVTGRNCPSFYQADKIAKALGCSTDDFRYVDNLKGE
jgi:predicted XRE-type DNA-binding protein